jgi:hypothetical protein
MRPNPDAGSIHGNPGPAGGPLLNDGKPTEVVGIDSATTDAENAASVVFVGIHRKKTIPGISLPSAAGSHTKQGFRLMSQPSEPPYEGQTFSPEPQKKGMSTTTIVLLTGGLGCGLLLLLCCGGFVYLGYAAKDIAENAVSTDPEVVAATTEEIASIEIPPDFKPLTSVRFKMPFMDDPIYVMAQYQTEDAMNTIWLAEFSAKYSQGDSDDMIEQVKDSELGNNARMEEFDAENSSERTFTIRGEEVTFTFTHGKDYTGEVEYLHAVGSFQGDIGPVVLVIQVDASKYDEQQIQEIIESIE